MKRDMETVKAVLEAIESLQNGGIRHEDLQLPEVQPDVVGYHLMLLAEGGYIVGDDATTMGAVYPRFLALRLTWQGHEAPRHD